MNTDWIFREWPQILNLLTAHTVLTIGPILIALVIALPLGWMANRTRILRTITLGTSGLLYTIPSLALFILLPAILGTKILDPANIVIALTIYSVALLTRTVCDGLDSVPDETVQAAKAIGYRPFQSLVKIELPIAVPVIAAGLRVAVVSNVSIVSLAALLGIPQLGSLFTQGFQLNFYTPIIVGILLCILLAVTLDAAVILLNKVMTPWVPRRSHR